MDKAAVPQLADALGVKLGLGKLIGGSQGRFEIDRRGEFALWDAAQDKPTRIVFGHADEPDSLEAAQYKGAVCDEAGQKKFKQESWEAIQRRLSIDKGRALFPTTPYAGFGWLKTQVYDRAIRGADQYDADYGVVNFESVENPAFPIEEWYRAMNTLPAWKFDLFYRGMFTRPAGAVYDCFDPEIHVIESVPIPTDWTRIIGIDFGAPNFAACFIAEEREEVEGPSTPGRAKRWRKTGRRVVYAEYRPESGATAKEHVAAMRKVEQECRKKWNQPPVTIAWRPEVCVGGSKGEGQWRNEFAACGWPMQPPDTPEVEVQIGRVYAELKNEQLFLSTAVQKLINDVQSYSRPVDEQGNVLEGIEDKETFHGADSLRYGIAYVERPGLDFRMTVI